MFRSSYHVDQSKEISQISRQFSELEAPNNPNNRKKMVKRKGKWYPQREIVGLLLLLLLLLVQVTSIGDRNSPTTLQSNYNVSLVTRIRICVIRIVGS